MLWTCGWWHLGNTLYRTLYCIVLYYCPVFHKWTMLNIMFIGPCIIAIVEEWKTNLMSLAIFFHLLCAQHVSDINMSIFRSLRLCWWITTSVVLFSVRCVLEFLLRLIFGGVRFAGWSTVVLQPAIRALLKTSRTKSPTHNELRTRQPMW